MAGSIGLQHLVEAIASSVIEAQDRLEQYQLSSLRRYFDEDNRPRQLSMVVPSMSPESDKDAQVRVPWLAVIRPNQLSIKDLQIDLEVGLVDFAPRTEELSEQGGPQEIPERDRNGTVQVDVASARPRDAGNVAKIVLRIEGHEPSEGLNRMIHELVKRIRTEEE